MATILCTNCRRPYPEDGVPYRCPTCGGLFDFASNWAFDRSQVTPLETSPSGLWRYRHTFWLPESAPAVTLGEGNTPLTWAEAFGRQVAFKREYENPTGSFKDRGSALLASFLLARGVRAAVEDSSGNAGASFAAYAKQAGMQATIYVPDSASGPKLNQMYAYGAEVKAIPGPRTNTAEAVRTAADAGAIYASHAYLPHLLPGYATVAYELFEQMGGAPGTIIVPAGQGNLLLGIGRGFQALKAAGLVERLPVLVGVQARACAPLWAVSRFGAAGLAWVTEGPTLAEGVRIKHPLHGDALLALVASTGGAFFAVDEEEILPARDQLAQRGLQVEPTSAIAWSALGQVAGNLPDPIVVVLTGAGFKYQPA